MDDDSLAQLQLDSDQETEGLLLKISIPQEPCKVGFSLLGKSMTFSFALQPPTRASSSLLMQTSLQQIKFPR